jgi:GR25 family glycosyltransferase involved in LPS biosynthesis
MKKLNIYFIHAKYMKERESVIENFKIALKKHRFSNVVISSVNVIDDYDPDKIDMQIIRDYVSYEKITDTKTEFYNQLLRNMHVNQLSNTLKHRHALELISKNSNDSEINMILEDDILYEERMCYNLDRLLGSLQSKHQIVFLGMPTTSENVDKSSYVFQDTHELFKVLPFCDSYIVSSSVASKLIGMYKPIKFVNNIQLSYIADTLDVSTVQCIPNIFIDGSKYGMFLSKMNANNPLIFNNDYNELRSLVSKDNPTNEDKKKVDKLLLKTPIKNNPDFIHQECLYHMKNEDYTKAKSRYEFAYNTYMSNGCVLSSESAFLKDYIRCFKYFQDDIREL